MSIWSLLLYLLSAFYLLGAIFELPLMFEGNFKSRWLLERMGKRNLKLLLIAMASIFAVLGMNVR